MEMTGEFRIPAPRQRVWEGLNDPEVLKQCIPGCQALEKVSDTEFNGRVIASVGPVRATFGGKVTLSDLDPPQSYTISDGSRTIGAGGCRGRGGADSAGRGAGAGRGRDPAAAFAETDGRPASTGCMGNRVGGDHHRAALFFHPLAAKRRVR